uniref:ribosomal protein L32 n=1 Tax=Cotinus nanus TaxID=1540407 RepID=UPI002201F6CF|nr:ribosomal protein L32 [Cotinus nanus]UXP74939.1 ribosomal protein L32 [Cotinus nanus]
MRMAVPKKRTSKFKKRIRKNGWKRGGILGSVESFFVSEIPFHGEFTKFFCTTNN